jgi:hypothetical protein
MGHRDFRYIAEFAACPLPQGIEDHFILAHRFDPRAHRNLKFILMVSVDCVPMWASGQDHEWHKETMTWAIMMNGIAIRIGECSWPERNIRNNLQEIGRLARATSNSWS